MKISLRQALVPAKRSRDDEAQVPSSEALALAEEIADIDRRARVGDDPHAAGPDALAHSGQRRDLRAGPAGSAAGAAGESSRLSEPDFTPDMYRDGGQDLVAEGWWRPRELVPSLVMINLFWAVCFITSPPQDSVGWLVLSLLTLVLVLLAVVALVPDREGRDRRAEEARRRARKHMLEHLSSDVLGWPAWTLGDAYPLLNVQARAAARPLLNDAQFERLLRSSDGGGTIGEQVALAQGTPLPRIERVEVLVVRSDRRDQEMALLRTRHAKLREEYEDHLLDPVAALRWPQLNDVTDPHTAELVESYELLSMVSSTEDTSVYREALERAWKAWRGARASAMKVGTTRLGRQERKRVQRAQKLLALALDPSSNEFERVSAHEQVKKLVDGIVLIPSPAQEILDSALRPAVAARGEATTT